MYHLQLRIPFRKTWSIHTDCDNLAKRLQLKYGRFITQTDCAADRDIYAIRKENAYIFRSLEGEKLLPTAIFEIDRLLFQYADYDEQVLALHGAAVSWDGQAYVFLARSTTGKTTLAAYLAQTGFGYITDDCVFVDRTDLQVYPYPKPLHLRDGGLEVLQRYNATPEHYQTLDDDSALRHVYTPEQVVESPLPLGGIYFLTRTENENRVEPMMSNERIMELMHSPITPYPVTGPYIQLMARIAKIPCARLIYSDMAFVAEVIRNGN